MGHAHFKYRKGSQAQAIDYTAKGIQTKREWKKHGRNGPSWGIGSQWIEIGDKCVSSQGTRTDLNKIYSSVKEGKNDLEIIDEFGFSAYNSCYRAIAKVRLLIPPVWDNSQPRNCVLLVGDTGIGKSRWAFDNYPDLYRMPIQKDFKWWDGYEGQATVLIDEFEGSMPLFMFLQITDRYLYKVETKGGTVHMVAPRIIVTTNSHPRSWYSWDKRENKEYALKRRFQEIWGISTNDILERLDPELFWPVSSKFQSFPKYPPLASQPPPPQQYPMFDVVKEMQDARVKAKEVKAQKEREAREQEEFENLNNCNQQ